MGCRDKGMLVPLAFDGELDAETAGELTRHLASCPACAHDAARLQALRVAIRDLPRATAPAGLKDRILAGLPAAERVEPWHRRRPVRLLALGVGLGAALAAVLLIFVHPVDPAEERLAGEIVARNAEAIVGDRVTDFTASDPAQVAPWLKARLDLAVPVRDLSAGGYALAGARLDRIGGHETPALVYRHHAHLLTLYVLPTPGAPPGDSDAVTRQGYAICHWTLAGVTYWAVGDVPPDDLEAFEAAVTAEG